MARAGPTSLRPGARSVRAREGRLLRGRGVWKIAWVWLRTRRELWFGALLLWAGWPVRGHFELELCSRVHQEDASECIAAGWPL